jgi:hypothetical protein
VIDGRTYTSDVVVFTDRVISNWRRKQGHQLSIEDIDDVLRENPEILVVGTGSSGFMRVLPQTESRLKGEKIELIAAPTDEACRIFNDLMPARRVVACLHLTC